MIFNTVGFLALATGALSQCIDPLSYRAINPTVSQINRSINISQAAYLQAFLSVGNCQSYQAGIRRALNSLQQAEQYLQNFYAAAYFTPIQRRSLQQQFGASRSNFNRGCDRLNILFGYSVVSRAADSFTRSWRRYGQGQGTRQCLQLKNQLLNDAGQLWAYISFLEEALQRCQGFCGRNIGSTGGVIIGGGNSGGFPFPGNDNGFPSFPIGGVNPVDGGVIIGDPRVALSNLTETDN